MVWTAGTFVTDVVVFVIIFFELPVLAVWVAVAIALFGLTFIHLFFLYGGITHAHIMRLYPILNRYSYYDRFIIDLNIILLNVHKPQLFPSNSIFVTRRYTSFKQRMSLMNTIERLGGSFVGFTCHDLYGLDLNSYREILISSILNFLLMIELLKSLF